MRGTFLLFVLAALCAAAEPDYSEFKVKRQERFEFDGKPALTRSGDQVFITFKTQAFCDVTVAIEDTGGNVLRHLACGVLGPNAPEPFEKNVLAQTLVWDGKDERGRYLDDKDRVVVRVALGLKPQFERSLYWEPKKRAGAGAGMGASTGSTLPVPLIVPAPEGVYVFEGHGTDHLRLFGHDGNYLRTIYPFPADQVGRVEGLSRAVFPPDNQTLPFKLGYVQATLLSSGTTASHHHGQSRFGTAASALAVRDGRIALAFKRLNRLATDGSSGGLPIYGPKVTFPARMLGGNRSGGKDTEDIAPTSAAFSPDGKYLYLAGYLWRDGIPSINLLRDGLPGVARMEFGKDAEPVPFLGSMKQGETGKDNARFMDAVSVACDAQGRVYVADFMNDRVQVFSPEGQHVKTLSTPKPARVQVHPQTGEIFVCSWAIQNDSTFGAAAQKSEIRVDPALTIFGPIDNPERKARVPIPIENYQGAYHGKDKWGGLQFSAAYDPWASPPTLWVVSGIATTNYVSGGGTTIEYKSSWEDYNIRVHALKGKDTALLQDFSAAVAQGGLHHQPPAHLRQRIYVNPKNRKLYLAEQKGMGKSFEDLLEIEPETGKVKRIPLPFDAEDAAFDLDGHIYLRSLLELARYDPEAEPWREVPFDYGEERDRLSYSSSATKRGAAVSCLPLYTGTLWHKGGLWVSPRGHLVISCYSTKDMMPHINKRTDEARSGGGSDAKEGEKVVRGNVYEPRFFPGRTYYGQVHVYDKHGKLLYEDVAPGIAVMDGVFIDQEDAVYCMAGSTRVFGGKPYFSDFTGTLLKFPRNAGRIVSSGGAPVPLPPGTEPKRAPDMIGGFQGKSWIEGAAWLYGGAGYAGRAFGCARMGGITCACANSRFAFDYYKRSFVPEFDRCQVGILDSNGNLILRVGRYGNVDDGKPLVPSGPPHARAIGGDETSFFYPVYLATDTDRRLFVSDLGNQRIVSVRLGYHREERLALKDAGRAP